MTGYLHSGYAESLSEFGEPHILLKSRGWILERAIPGCSSRDAMGCYPLFTCLDWSGLEHDVDDLSTELVSLSVVLDPFGSYDLTRLRKCFHDVMIPFKEHFVTDLSQSIDAFVSPHNRRYARKGLGILEVERCEAPLGALDQWTCLYHALVARHRITGLARFSRDCFEKQFQVPGVVVFRAVHRELTIGMTVWFSNRGVGYYHLGAYSDIGYNLHAAFALFWFAISYFAAQGLEWLDLGASPGVNRNEAGGLSRFKRGWSTGTRTAYLGGRIFDPEGYQRIVNARGNIATDYFPAYRQSEFDR